MRRQGSVEPRGHAACFLGGIGEGACGVAAQIASITSLWGSAIIYPGAPEHHVWSSTLRASPDVCLGHAGPRR